MLRKIKQILIILFWINYYDHCTSISTLSVISYIIYNLFLPTISPTFKLYKSHRHFSVQPPNTNNRDPLESYAKQESDRGEGKSPVFLGVTNLFIPGERRIWLMVDYMVYRNRLLSIISHVSWENIHQFIICKFK